MTLAWIPFAVMNVFFLGLGQVLAKKGITTLGSPGMLLLRAINTFAIFGVVWIFFHEDIHSLTQIEAVASCILAASLSSVGCIFFYEAVERQKISIVGVITASCPFVTAIFAVILLGEHLTPFQMFAIILIIIGVSLLSYSPREHGTSDRIWFLFVMLTLLCWGLWAVTAKFSIDTVGIINYAGINSLVAPAIWVPYWYARSRTFSLSRKDIYSEISVCFFIFGSLCFFGALKYGYASIVTAFSDLYPFVTLFFARFMLSEHLEKHHIIAIALAIIGIFGLTH